jgi:predicted PurR-regulated permease PerM
MASMTDEAGEKPMDHRNRDKSRAQFAHRVLIVAVLTSLFFLAWHLRHIFVLALGAVVIAAVLLAATDATRRIVPLGHGWSLAIAGVLILLGISAIVWVGWPNLKSQSSNLLEQLPQAVSELESQLGIEFTDQSGELSGTLEGLFGSILRDAANFLQTALLAATGLVLVVIAGIYLAINPKLYKAGLTLLFPPEQHDRANRALNRTGRALKLWLIGQLISMTIVGVLVGIGAWAIGLPSPLALALFAFLTDFVPYIGPLVGAIPGLLLALGNGWDTVLWAGALYLGVQQIESHLVAPLVQQETVKIPPALFLLSSVAMGALFGISGVVLAGPLTVTAFVLVRTIYIEETLGESLE